MSILENDPDYYEKMDLPIYKNEIDTFIPSSIFDFHVHIWKKEHWETDFDDKSRLNIPVAQGQFFDIEDAKKSMEILYPGKKYKMLIFGMPIPGLSIDKMNQYISSISDKVNIFGMFIPTIGDKVSEIEKKFLKGNFFGFKPYPDLVTWKDPRNVNITDFATKEQFEIANHYSLMIILHISKVLRLADPENINQIKNLCQKYPKVKVILAHAGRSYCPNNIKAAIEQIKDIPNLFYDLSMINNEEVFEVILRNIDINKLLFATDLPIAFHRGKNICINGEHYFVTRKSYPWSLSSPFINVRTTFFAYEIIRAFKTAAEKIALNKDDIKRIFYCNAMELINN
ncbi:MAG: amidohydrolase family protein [Actinobacteria bacterium]|nr:amidohydrolase family protein [Actinomycetota bacterium]